MTPRKRLQSLMGEKRELDTKLDKLSEFLYTDSFHKLRKKQQALLIQQSEHMGNYSHVLEVRIADLKSQK